MWLTGRLAPDFKTIADFRKDNGEAIRLVCREFVMLCRKVNLLTDTLVAIDGSKFKAVNNRDKNFTRTKMKRRLADVEASIDRYLGELDSADEAAPPEQTQPIQDRIAKPGIVGYNVQTAVDTQHHLIVTHEVTNAFSDRRQLAKMANKVKAELKVDHLQVLADRGYYNSEEIRACEQNGITPLVPKSLTSNNRAKGQFDRSDFVYKGDQTLLEFNVPPLSDQRSMHDSELPSGQSLGTRGRARACTSAP
jgi:hypothetical protein